jgi:type IV secretory pathway VirB10-like protein
MASHCSEAARFYLGCDAMSVGRATRALVIATVAVGTTMSSCGGAVTSPESAVASPDARATARAQREARRAALDEQGDRPKKSKVEIAAPPPPQPLLVDEEPEPEADEEEEVEEEVAAIDAPPTVVPKAPAKPDKNAICISLCDRAVACAREMFGDASGDFGQDMLEPMLRRIAEQCREECQNELDEAELEEAQTCLEASDCDAFMECVQNLKDD